MNKVGIIVLIIVLMILVISFMKVLVFAIHNNNWNWFLSFGSSKELRKNEYIRKEESIDLTDIDIHSLNSSTIVSSYFVYLGFVIK